MPVPFPSASRRIRFEQVVRAYSHDLFRYLYWLCRDRALAEDLVQETFARAWSAWEAQRDEKAVRAWLYTIARNENARFHGRKRPEVDAEANLEEIASGQPADPSLALDLRKAFGQLPAGYREPLLLQVLGGLSSAEIAAAIGVREEAVNMRLSRARRALAALMEGAPGKAGTTREVGR
jgi:RNA polymerase sigma-70 factor (ECF subfamily)